MHTRKQGKETSSRPRHRLKCSLSLFRFHGVQLGGINLAGEARHSPKVVQVSHKLDYYANEGECGFSGEVLLAFPIPSPLAFLIPSTARYLTLPPK